MKGLPPKQELFVTEYLLDLNAAAAYRRAGYSARTDHEASVGGSRLLAKAGIAARVAAAQAERAARLLITADEVLRGLRREATLTGEGSSHSARVAAWKALGKHLGLFVDRVRLEGGITLEIVEELVHVGHNGQATPSHNGQASPGPARILPQ